MLPAKKIIMNSNYSLLPKNKNKIEEPHARAQRLVCFKSL